MHTGKPAKMSAFVDFQPAHEVNGWSGRIWELPCQNAGSGRLAPIQSNWVLPGVSNLTFFPHCFPSFGMLGGLWKDPLQAVGTVLVILCRSVSQFVNLAGLREDETWTAPWAVHARRELFSRQIWRKIGELRISGAYEMHLQNVYAVCTYGILLFKDTAGQGKCWDDWWIAICVYIYTYMYIYMHTKYTYTVSPRGPKDSPLVLLILKSY